MKFCKDCKWYDCGSFLPCCAYYNKGELDPIDGRKTYSGYETCTSMRGNYAFLLFKWRHCGKAGKYWETK